MKMESKFYTFTGILNINKPINTSSMNVVRIVKRFTKVKKVGHAGTLDPLASGVLPICLGQATRVMEDILNTRKTYRVRIHLGISTNTYDLEGEITNTRNINNIDNKKINKGLSRFIGEIDQVPPMYSALKIKGERLYKLARKGINLNLKPRKVNVFSIRILKWEHPFLTVDIECGKGFYVRSFANDFGELLGCGAHINELSRISNGIFHIESSIDLESFKKRVEEGNWSDLLHKIDNVLDYLPKINVDKKIEKLIHNGAILPKDLYNINVPDKSKCRVYNLEGIFLGMIIFDKNINSWKSYKNFNLGFNVINNH
tara:strand:- start:333 stop:1277 length:945 start_codon:yes stop_codon:yes gene_type:complete